VAVADGAGLADTWVSQQPDRYQQEQGLSEGAHGHVPLSYLII
jgi:hypothetical protein